MKSSHILAVAPLLSITHAIVQLDLVAKRGLITRAGSLIRRDNGDAPDGSTISQDTAYSRYFVNVTIGEPGQTFTLHMDTGSSDVWVNAKGANITLPPSDPQGPAGGTFDIQASSTASQALVDGLNISYVDGSGASGDLFQDSITIAGTKLENYVMGQAKTSSSNGILGLGMSNGLSFFQRPDIDNEKKRNLVDAMVSSNQIKSPAFSLWLNDIDSGAGALLFGGVDRKKFDGNLSSLAMYASPGKTEIDHPLVSLTSFTISTPSGNLTITPNDAAYPAILDSGAAQTILPDAIVKAIYAQTGATYFAPYNVAAVPCSVRNVLGTFDFGLGGPNGPIIRVPIGDLVYPAVLQNQPINIPNSNQTACVFGITPASARGLGEGADSILGDTFIRSAYVVYDFANKRVGIAQTRYNSTESDIVGFESPGAPIPAATTVQDERKFTVTEVKPVVQFTQDAPVFNGPVGSAFAAAYTGDLAFVTAKPTTTPNTPGGNSTIPVANPTPPSGSLTPSVAKPILPAATSSISAAGVSPKPFAWDQLTVLGLTISMFAAGGMFIL